MDRQISEINNQGFVTLMSVLLVAAIGTAVATLTQSNQAKALANACMEEALQQIQESTPFSGSGSLSIGQGSCAYTVVKLTGENRTATSSGTVGVTVRKVKVAIDKLNPGINITSWQEVADF